MRLARQAGMVLVACTLFALCTAHADTAADRRAPSAKRLSEDSGQTWICRYHVDSRHLWYIQCESLKSADADPALGESASRSGVVRNIPIYGPPIDSASPKQLARAVMCHRASDCTVFLTSSLAVR